eukprot:s273_g22.t1
MLKSGRKQGQASCPTLRASTNTQPTMHTTVLLVFFCKADYSGTRGGPKTKVMCGCRFAATAEHCKKLSQTFSVMAMQWCFEASVAVDSAPVGVRQPIEFGGQFTSKVFGHVAASCLGALALSCSTPVVDYLSLLLRDW